MMEHIATIIVGTIAAIGLIGSTWVGGMMAIRLRRLDEKNDLQHAQADIARVKYGQDRARDHEQTVSLIGSVKDRMAIIENVVASHIEWEEQGKYKDLVVDHARLIAERKEIAAMVKEALESGGQFPLDRVVDVLAGNA